MTDINGIFSFCEAVGTAAFAVSGAMVAVDRETDIFGVLLMAVFTALGGGTLRDVLIGYFPPRMFTNFHYVLLACLCALVVFVIARVYKERYVAREKMIEQSSGISGNKSRITGLIFFVSAWMSPASSPTLRIPHQKDMIPSIVKHRVTASLAESRAPLVTWARFP